MTAKPKATLAASGDQRLTLGQLDQPIQKMLIGRIGAPIIAWVDCTDLEVLLVSRRL